MQNINNGKMNIIGFSGHINGVKIIVKDYINTGWDFRMWPLGVLTGWLH